MTASMTLDDVAALAERFDLECKSAQGRDGRGELPDDFWKSYSAMANGDGGVIWLGIQEKPRGEFRALGLSDVARVRKALWDNLHNRNKVSANVLGEADVQPVDVNGLTVLRVQVPRGARPVKPVHLGANPFGNTYLRRHEGDYVADDETVRRMLAERVEDSRDERFLKHFDFDDLDMETVAAYRNRFAAVKPGHVWADLAVPDFLERIGAFGKDREGGGAALRLAGLLMFGRAEVIRDALPNYMVDYQERPQAQTERRWIDRLVPDGSWSGNVYDFFRKVYGKLTAELKVPFQLSDGQRVEDTRLHEALREALANTLIHADFSGRVSVLVVKRPDMFGFRNPGLMRVSVEQALAGGTSDCRNRRMQTMFQLVGYGDHAGSGIPKIYRNWADQHWRIPVLRQQVEPEQTLMELHMSSLLSAEVVADLQVRLGRRFEELAALERLALVTASVEREFNHTRMKEMSSEHPSDISKRLAKLVRDGLLSTQGTGRGLVYFLPWLLHRQPSASFNEFEIGESGRLPSHSNQLTPELESLTPELRLLTPELDEQPGSDKVAVVSELSGLSPERLQALTRMAQAVSLRRRTPPALVSATVLALCEEQYLGLRVLAALLGRRDRDGGDLRKRILNPLVSQGQLKRAFSLPNDPRQGYMKTQTPMDTAPDKP